MKGGVATPERVVDITRLPGLSAIERLPDGATRVGALVRNSDLAHDPAFAKDYPMVAEALLAGASAQLRNAATVGGNLMQRTRCPYFTDAVSPCNKRAPGSGCAALGHATRIHAVQGWSEHCIATTPVRFLRAARRARRGGRDRRAGRRPGGAAHRFPPPARRPSGAGDRPAARRADHRRAAAARRPPTFRAHARYLKVRDRTSYAFAVVSAAAALTPRGEAGSAGPGSPLAGWRSSPGGWRRPRRRSPDRRPPPRPTRRPPTPALAGAEPTGEANAFKIELARRVAVRALTQAAAGTPARIPALPASPFGIV